jgi:hypothetical protein
MPMGEIISKDVLTYPTTNRFLQFFGDTMLLIGSLFTNVGLRYGGVYEYEFEDTKG